MFTPLQILRKPAAALLAAALLALGGEAVAQTDVGVSINFAQPGMYGRIDIGNVAPPPVVYAQPMVIQQGVYAAPPQPIYLRVPPEHQRHWARHCREYRACGVPVYFVREDWYRDNYRGRDGHWHERDFHEDHGRGHDHEGDHDRGRDHERERDHEDRGRGHHHDD